MFTRVQYKCLLNTHTYLLHNMQFQTDFDPIIFHPTGKVRHPKYYKHLKKGSHQSK